jgi:hypothetical protein
VEIERCKEKTPLNCLGRLNSGAGTEKRPKTRLDLKPGKIDVKGKKGNLWILIYFLTNPAAAFDVTLSPLAR